MDMQNPGGLAGIVIAADECGEGIQQIQTGVAPVAPKWKQKLRGDLSDILIAGQGGDDLCFFRVPVSETILSAVAVQTILKCQSCVLIELGKLRYLLGYLTDATVKAI